jgi:hypothetical protein
MGIGMNAVVQENSRFAVQAQVPAGGLHRIMEVLVSENTLTCGSVER